jgi:hypothetical protein
MPLGGRIPIPNIRRARMNRYRSVIPAPEANLHTWPMMAARVSRFAHATASESGILFQQPS